MCIRDRYQAGTLSGNPIAMAAGAAQLRELSSVDAYERLELAGATLEAGLRAAISQHSVPVQFTRIGSIFGLFFNEHRVRDVATAQRSDANAYAAFFHAMLDRGVYLAPSASEVGFLSLAHSSADIDDTIIAAQEALATLPTVARR